IVYDPAYRGPIDAGDLGKCVSIFHVLAIVFAGTHPATEINAGSTALSFLTQKRRWASLAAQAAVQWAFLAGAYVVAIALARAASGIRWGSAARSFLTQKGGWASWAERAAVRWACLACAYVVGIGVPRVAGTCWPAGLAMSPRGCAYLAAYLLVVLLWATMA